MKKFVSDKLKNKYENDKKPQSMSSSVENI